MDDLKETQDKTSHNSSQNSVHPVATRPLTQPIDGGAVISNGITHAGCSIGDALQTTSALSSPPTKTPSLMKNLSPQSPSNMSVTTTHRSPGSNIQSAVRKPAVVSTTKAATTNAATTNAATTVAITTEASISGSVTTTTTTTTTATAKAISTSAAPQRPAAPTSAPHTSASPTPALPKTAPPKNAAVANGTPKIAALEKSAPTIATVDAFRPKGNPFRVNGNSSQTASSSMHAVTQLSLVKRKSPVDSLNGHKAVPNGKKRKTEKPVPGGNKSSKDIRAPLASFSTPPGQRPMRQEATIVDNASKGVPLTKTWTKHKVAEKDFVTIKIGSVEENTKNEKAETVSKIKKSNISPTSTSNSVLVNTTTPSTISKKKVDYSNEIVSQFTTFPSLKGFKDVRPLRSLSTSERVQLERLFEFDKRKSDGKTWDEDWFGVLDLCNLEVENPDGREGERQKKRSLIDWVGLNTKVGSDGRKKNSSTNHSLKLLNNLLRHVYNYNKVPEQAKLILANTDPRDPRSIGDSIQRLSIDPIVLQQDGWTTAKAKEPQGASGGAHRIGEKIWWQGYLGVVIAFVHDDDIGDLWKAIWVEDLATFDLEREELEDSRKKYERKKAASNEKKKKQAAHNKALNIDFKVAGIEHGIVLATSYARGARHGVFWPARVLHASELVGNTNRRSKSKKKVDVVFLAPYWNGDPKNAASNGSRRTEPFSGTNAKHRESVFSSGPIFEVESIDAHSTCIQSYPYDAAKGLDIDALRTAFKFTGLPKVAFSRLLDSHRLALGFKTYSQTELKSTRASDSDRTSAALLEGHPLAVQAPNFPVSVLQLPFVHILSQLPQYKSHARLQSYNDSTNEEPALRFNVILDAMKPPNCWGVQKSTVSETPQLNSFISSPVTFLDKNSGTRDDPFNTGRFLAGLLSLKSLLSDNSPTSRMLKSSLNELVSTFAKSSSLQDLQSPESKKRHIKSLNKVWVVVKSKGETLILAALKHKKFQPFLKDWRRCCERIYRHINVGLGSNGKSWVITDSRCNLHLTSSECFERAVRLPAALKGVRQARGNIEIIHGIEDSYITLAENDVIRRAHKMPYINRIKKRCMAATEDNVVALTEDSDGNGGEDTKGSKGSWTAALLGVGAALKGLDMIINGECLNVFCATRPPGHHAGRELHAMKAVSNGFCILNSVACAALYATAPITDGGLGLSRVCVIDIDVHHGNGTQDILCSSYDPRFLYISLHAGGPDINGLDVEDDDLEQIEHHLGGNPKKGIFPGRCGDTSPHQGVVNIPLGGRVTSHALGTALVTKVSPAVEAFNPDIIIISAGFDAHQNDPLNMGGLTADDFGTLTEVICKLAYKCCSGRVLSVMEGGYGVPCCRHQNFDKRASSNTSSSSPYAESNPAESKDSNTPKQQDQFPELMCLDLGSDLPPSMTDVISSYALQKRLDKCHKEGFVHCVREHVSALARCNIVLR